MRQGLCIRVGNVRGATMAKLLSDGIKCQLESGIERWSGQKECNVL